MSELFKKAVLFTDLHIGLKSNSIQHLNDCWNYLNWMVAEAKKEGCETCFFLGDWHNHRATINVVALNFSVRCMELLSRSFEQVFFIPGNHDQFFRDKRDIHSAEWAKHLPNITIINDFFERDKVSIVPWLVKDEHKHIQKIRTKYMFGHFELPHFYMNAMIQMPDHGEIRKEDFSHIEHVFSGHFHKRQSEQNITYIGNCFPHNYSDAGDDDRGCAFLEWGGTLHFRSWPDQPRYRIYNFSDVLQNEETLLRPNMYVRINLDVEISYEEAAYVKDTLINKYGLREVSLIPRNESELSNAAKTVNMKFESVDQIVYAQIQLIESDYYSQELLLDIYRSI